mgnify:CR=1 FL=1
MSHSFGILPSRIVFYEQSDKRLYVNENSARSYRMPEMIEQIVVEGDELYVLFESGAYAYRGYAGNVVDRVHEAESDKNGRVLSGRVLKSVCPHILSVKR